MVGFSMSAARLQDAMAPEPAGWSESLAEGVIRIVSALWHRLLRVANERDSEINNQLRVGVIGFTAGCQIGQSARRLSADRFLETPAVAGIHDEAMSLERTVSLALYVIYAKVAIAAGPDPSVGRAVTGEQNDRGRSGQVLGKFRSVLGFTDVHNPKTLSSPLIPGNGRDSIGEFTVIAGVHDVQIAGKAIGHGRSLPERDRAGLTPQYGPIRAMCWSAVLPIAI
jgi:hypothetical protein